MSDQRFLPQYRVRRGSEFQRVFRLRCAAGDQRIVLFGHPNGLPYPRLGLSVSRKVGGAVARNRWKRLIREAFRLTRQELPPGVDLVAVPKQNVEPDLVGLMSSLPRLARKIAKRLCQDQTVTQEQP